MSQPAGHAGQPAGQPLWLLSLNPNGLGNPAKRRDLFSKFIQGPWHILLIQEAHLASEEQLVKWMQDGAGLGMPLRGWHFANPHTSASAGVLAIIKGDAPLDDVRLVAAPAGGRLLDIVISYAGMEMSLVNCYAPCEGAERPDFFERQLAQLLPADRPIIAAGDWNCVSEPLDVVGTDVLGGRGQGAGQLEALQVGLGLVDAWRQCHAGERAFTHWASSTGTGARLDRWYVSAALADWVRRCDIQQDWPGDHNAVGLVLTPPTTYPSAPTTYPSACACAST